MSVNNILTIFIILYANGIICEINESLCQPYLIGESKYRCGLNGYPIGFGYKNCMVFTNNGTRERFSNEGRMFVDCCSECLVSSFRNIIDTVKTCDQILEKSFKTHVHCYIKCGFCRVCKTQKFQLFKSYHISDFLSILSFEQIYKIIRKCGVFTCFT